MTTQVLRSLLQALLPAIAALALAAPAAADPPGRVGRIAWMSGTVQLRNADTGEWNTAVLNYPLTSGDALSTGPGARLEIGIGSTKVRLDSSSELSIDQIDDERVRLYLTSGSASVRLRSRESAREFELATRDGRFTTQDVGAFRFDYAQNVTSATTYLGTLHFEAEDSELDIPNGQRAQFWYSGRTAYSFTSPVRDDFSEWSMARDRSQATSSTRRYVSQEMTGYEDLASHGDWYDSVDYGPVWYPSVVAAGWAPYRTGHWAWVAPWGWTWIDDAPWGFAPFHYGRWVWHRNRWGWTPGRHVVRPVYAPALVAWVGTPHLSISVSSQPAVGWFPLAPREVYVPSYRCSPSYVRNVNITHVTHIHNVNQIINEPHRVMEHTRFANRHFAHAVTVVPAEVMTQRRPVAPAVEHPRNPRFLETIKQHAPLAQAPVAAPPRPPRVDGDRRDRDRGGESARERRPSGEWPANDRRGAPPSATPLPPPLNANSAPTATQQSPGPQPGSRQPHAQPPRGEPRRAPEPASADGAIWNRPTVSKPAAVPPPAAAQPPTSSPPPRLNDQRPHRDSPREAPRAERTPESPWGDRPPSSRPSAPAPAAVPQPPAAAQPPGLPPPPRPDDQRPHRESPRESPREAPRAEPRRAPDSPWGDGPRMTRPAAPAPAATPPSRPADPRPHKDAQPAEPPRTTQPIAPQRHWDPPPAARPREPAALPSQPMPPPRHAREPEPPNPPPARRPAMRSEPGFAAPPSPPPQRSQPMPPREVPPAQAHQPQNPRHQAEKGQAPSAPWGQGGQPQKDNPHRRGDERDNR